MPARGLPRARAEPALRARAFRDLRPRPYEPAETPELALDTDGCDLWTQVQEVVYLARRLARQAAAARSRNHGRIACK